MPPKLDQEDPNMQAARFGRLKNDLSMGILGLPNIGKSTLTNLLSGTHQAEAANYPFCTIEPNVVRCVVPDPKLKYLQDTYKSASYLPAVLKVVDIAGLIRGASEGAGLGNAFLSHISSVDGLYHVVRAFDSEEVIHVDDSVDPIRDLETIEAELCLKDLSVLEAQLMREQEKMKKEKGLARSNSNVTVNDSVISSFEKCKSLLEETIPVQAGDFTNLEVNVIKDWGLLTTKPQVYVINMSQKNFIRKGSKWLPKIKNWVNEHGGGMIIPMSCEFEEKLVEFKEDPEGKDNFLKECTQQARELGLMGHQFVAKSVIPRLIRLGRQSLCLQSYYTAGPKETRAWTIQKGTLAPQAAGVIHSDFERGFIKAEVCNFNDFKELHEGLASMAKVKEAGKYRQEGKGYIMQEGDIVNFMHNVSGSKKK